MKNIFLSLALSSMISICSLATDSTKFYLMPHVQLVPKTGQTGITLGADAAYSPIHRFFVGVSYQQIVNRFMPLTEDDIRKELTSKWGGLKFEYQAVNHEKYKVYTHVAGGAGILDIIIDEAGALPDEQENYSYFQLGVNFDMPISYSFSISLGWQYRFVSEIQYKNVTSQDIGGVSSQFGLRYFFNR